MNVYKVVLSALLLAPVAGGIGIHMLHNYQELKQQAETVVVSANEQMESVEKLLNDPEFFGDTDQLAKTEAFDDIDLLIGSEDLDNINALNGLETSADVNALNSLEPSDDVTSAVIRFHVRANSDSDEDQALKLLVRDGILEMLGPELAEAKDKDEARSNMEKKLTEIERTGEAIVQAAGYDYEVHAYLTTEEFPMKSYGDLLFPAGEYEALRVDIGKQEGANWWCVMYPGLCFVDATGGIVAENGKEELEQILTPEEYRELLLYPEEDTKIEYRSLLWDWLSQ